MNKRIPIGFQLWAVRAECDRDLPAALARLAAIGYEGVEPWGYDGQAVEWKGRDAATLRRMLDDAGLTCCGMHMRTEALVGDCLARTVELNRALGNRFLVVASDKQRMSTAAGIRDLARILDGAARSVAREGLCVGYHAHGFDFARVDGAIAWDTLFSSTRPEVIMQLDNGNCASGGGDPIATLRRFPGRVRSMHLKEHGAAAGKSIGEGAMGWVETFRLCETTQNTEWYVVEEGSADGAGFDVPARAYEALRKMGKTR